MSKSESRSLRLHELACQFLPGGVSRNTVYRKPNPDYLAHGQGAFVTDLDGVTRMDLANNMASLIHGHAHPEILEAVWQQLQRGSAVSMANEAEFLLARLLCERVPWFDKIRFMNSGTEAVMAAIKVARAITGRPAVAKAEGTYHGTYDYAEISQNAGPENWGPREQPNPVPVAKGTPQGVLQDVVVFPFNDLPRTLTLLDQNRARLACVLVDLVPQRAGLIPADPEYIHGLRQWTQEHDVLLIFDEVISFRMGYCGAAEGYGVHPDITTLGKIIGGGFPIGGLAGKQEIMAVMDPTRADLPLPWSGTFSANPISMTAGRVAMELFDRAAIERINALGEYTRCQIAEMMEAMQLAACVTGVGSMFRIHPRRKAPHDYRSTWQDPDQLRQTQQLVDTMYQCGYLMFRTATAALSTATTKADMDQYLVHLSESMANGFRDV